MHHNKLFAITVLLSAAVSAAAQDIDPTVEVSRIYQGKMMEVHKPMIGMQIPDSVMHFDLDFDYSVFDNPYKGTNEFNPYVQDMKPQPDAWSGRRLFLRAGAGYPLHPVFDFVWSPDLKGKFRMSAYASHRSYVGKYRKISPVLDRSSGGLCLESPENSAFSGNGWSGYDFLTTAGVEGRLDWGKGIFSFNAGYHGLATRDTLVSRAYNALTAGLRVRSSGDRDRYFLYDVAVDYRYGADNLDYTGPSGSGSLSGHEFSLASAFGPVFSRDNRLTVGVGLDMVSYGGVFGTEAGVVTVTPKYIFGKGRWNLGAGILFSATFSGGEKGLLPAQDTKKGQYVYPDITASYDIILDHMRLYAEIGGGESIGRYSGMLEKGHFIHPLYTLAAGIPLMDNTIERISASLGLRGSIASRFSYDLSAGYRNFASVPLHAILSSSGTSVSSPSPVLGYTGLQMFYASLDYGWSSADFSLDGNFTYRHSDVSSDGVIPAGNGTWMSFFRPAAFSGDVRAMYNWHRRIYFGADCDFSLPRESALCRLGSYADLGIYLELRTARLFSFWIRGGNLLNMTVQRMPMYAESGINFTAGICLNL